MDSSHMSITLDDKPTCWLVTEAKTMDTIENDWGTPCHKQLP